MVVLKALHDIGGDVAHMGVKAARGPGIKGVIETRLGSSYKRPSRFRKTVLRLDHGRLESGSRHGSRDCGPITVNVEDSAAVSPDEVDQPPSGARVVTVARRKDDRSQSCTAEPRRQFTVMEQDRRTSTPLSRRPTQRPRTWVSTPPNNSPGERTETGTRGDADLIRDALSM